MYPSSRYRGIFTVKKRLILSSSKNSFVIRTKSTPLSRPDKLGQNLINKITKVIFSLYYFVRTRHIGDSIDTPRLVKDSEVGWCTGPSSRGGPWDSIVIGTSVPGTSSLTERGTHYN